MDPISSRGAQKCTHSFVHLDLEILAGGIFTVDRENVSITGLNTVRVDFEEVLLLRVRKGSESAQLVGQSSLTVLDQYWPPWGAMSI